VPQQEHRPDKNSNPCRNRKSNLCCEIAGGSTARLQEQFGYAYDKAWNLQRRTNNALVQTFGVNNRNELTNATRSGTLTVAGLASVPGAGLSSVVVSGTGLSSGNANVYADGSWARSGAALADGTNSYTATANESSSYPYHGRTAQDSVTVNLPASGTFQYDGNGNLTNDGRRVFEYDCENQLTNVYVASAWRSEFKYDAFGRRRVRKEYGWSGSAWTLTNEVRYVYDGMLVVQERDGNSLALVSYTRGNDLSGSRQGAGGIGGLLARTDNSAFSLQHSYFHSDGNGNVTALVDTNGFIVAKYQYDPYGNLLGMCGPLAEANTYRFSSKEWHAASGLYYYGFRYYEPNLQRWLNRDPIGEAGGINLYGYCLNSPLYWIDPYGLHWTDYIPDFVVDPGFVNFTAGMGDALSFTITRRIRDANPDFYAEVDKCSGAYRGGQWTGEGIGFAMGGGRLAYAGIAKAESMALLRSGATAANAEKAIAFRNGLKEAFNLGMANKDKVMTMEKAMAKYAGDYAEIIKASGRTSPAWNAAGAAALGSATVSALSNPCKK
jgi:RHS repeat-associated protein